ncbi:MAG: DUF859 domain-containing protein [Coprococcus catus]|nr:DUF859 domain-containing protein [Coprococcus catus]
MATSAKKEVTCGYNGHYHLYMTITVNSQDKTNNKSNVTVKMYAKSDSTTYGAYNLSSSANSVKLTVDGSQKVNKTMAMDFRNMATVNLAEWTGDISHDSEGKKKLTCSGSFTIDGSSWLSGGDISLSIDLDDIPRATKPTLSVSSVELGKTLTIGIAPAVSGWKHNLYYRFGSGSWTKFASDKTGDYTWTVPKDLANSITDATSATLTIGLNTYNGSTQIGTIQTVNVKVTIPSSVKPSISSVTVSEAVSEIKSGYGVYIQGKSKLHIVTDAAGAYSSTISSIKHKIGGTEYTAKADYTSGFIMVSGDVSIVTTVTDSRGRTASKTTTITVYAYDAPKITKLTAIRCGEGGAVNNNGTYVKVSMAFSVSPVDNKNAKSYRLEYKTTADTDYTELTSGSVYSYDDVYITGGTFLAANSYDIRLTVTDSFTSSTASARVNTASRLLSYIIKKMAIAIGKVAEMANTFDVALETIFRKAVSMYDNLTVVGDISEGGTLLSKKYNPMVSVAHRNSSAIADKDVATANNTNLGSFTLAAGTWIVFIHVYFSANTNGRRAVWLATSATGSNMEGQTLDNRAPVNGAGTTCKIQAVFTPAVSTTYYLNCYQNSGSTLTASTRYTLIKLK